MKILIVSHEYPPIGGGGANACMFLARQYAARGNFVTIVSAWFDGLPEKEQLFDNRLIIYRVKAKRAHKEHSSFLEMFDYVVKANKLINVLMKSEKYDICQIFFGIPSGPIGLGLKLKYKLPYVIRFGGGDIPGFQNRFKILYKLMGIPLKAIWRNADALVANSIGLRDFALDFYNKCEISVINNGVDADVFAPREKSDADTVSLLFVSRLIERKGLQKLIPFLGVIQEKTGKKLHLTIVGDGPYRSELERLTDEYSVREYVSFVGQKDKDELPAYYSSGDVFVFPSYREGMPNAVLEAMASGLPIIMMEQCEGSKELVCDNGILCKNDIVNGVKDFLLLSREEQKKMAQSSREKTLREFSWDSISEQYIGLFTKIINDRK